MSPASGPGTRPPIAPKRWRRRLRSIEAAAVAGFICAVAWSIGLSGLLAAPSVEASDDEILRYYAEPRSGLYTLVLLQFIVIGTIAFLWFIGVVRARLGEGEPKLFGTVFQGGAILMAGVVLVGTAALAAPAVLVEAGGRLPDPGAASLTRALAVTLLSVFAPRVATVVIFSTAALGRATGALPRWLVWLSYAVGIFEFLNVAVGPTTVYVFPAWIALVSIVLLIRHPTRQASPVVD